MPWRIQGDLFRHSSTCQTGKNQEQTGRGKRPENGADVERGTVYCSCKQREYETLGKETRYRQVEETGGIEFERESDGGKETMGMKE